MWLRLAASRRSLVGVPGGRGVAVGVEQDKIGSQGVGELEGLLGAVGFDRGCAAKLEEHSQNFARFARGIDN